MNILLTSAGRRTYLVRYFKEALKKAGVSGLVHGANSQESPALAAAAALLAGVCFCGNILPLSENYVNRYFDYRAVWQETDAVLDRIPDDASVTATTFLVVPLSRRAVLYDLRYCSQEHLLSTDYVVVETTDSGSLKPYAVDGGDGLEGLTALLRAAGYAQLPDTGSRLQLWKRP